MMYFVHIHTACFLLNVHIPTEIVPTFMLYYSATVELSCNLLIGFLSLCFFFFFSILKIF